MTRSPSVIRAPEPEIFKSLGMQELCRLIQNLGSCSILDLGGAWGANIAFWARFGPSMHVADLHSAIPLAAPPQPEGTDEPVGPALDSIVDIRDGSRFDVILAWDLLNYLDPPFFAGLVRHLVRFCRPGTLLFALIYDRQQMPVLPIVFKVRDEENLIYESRSPETRPCPRHQPRDVQRMFAGFRVASSFRLRHGVQEYLFQYEV